MLWCIVILFCASVNCQCSFSEECINVKSCPLILKLLDQDPVPAKDVERLKKSQCGYNYQSNEPKVCCPKVATLIPDLNSDLLPDADVCGLDPSKRIVGGQLTILRQFPWLALLEYQKPDGKSFNCGGSLVNQNYVITAAHCIKRIPRSWKLISVRLGEHQLDTDPDCEDDDKPGFEDCADSPIDIPVEKIIIHPEYIGSVGQANDIALLKLSRPVSYTKSIQPICLPTSPKFLTNNFTGMNMVVTGFGRTETRSQSNIKLKVEVPIKSFQECSLLYKRHGATLTEKQFCAGGNKGEDSCTGDSGGPLMYLRQTDNEYNWYLYGVVSYGPIQCGTKNFPAIYSNVPHYMPWIINNIQQ